MFKGLDHYLFFFICRLNLISLSNIIEVTFITDDTVTGTGFVLDWKSEKVTPCVNIDDNVEFGTIKLPHMDAGYSLPYNCSHTITAPGIFKKKMFILALLIKNSFMF